MSNYLDQVERIANGINTTTSPEVLKNWVERQLLEAYKNGFNDAMNAAKDIADPDFVPPVVELINPVFNSEVKNG